MRVSHRWLVWLAVLGIGLVAWLPAGAGEPEKAAEPAKAPEPAKEAEPAKAPEPPKAGEPAKLKGEDNQLCIECHLKTTPSIVAQWSASGHAKAKEPVPCLKCHGAKEGDPGAYVHRDALIVEVVSPRICGQCHAEQVKQFSASRHAEAANVTGSLEQFAGDYLEGQAASILGCQSCHGSKVVIGADHKPDAKTWPNTGVGRINPDGTKGACSACHARHSFARAQARRPENCGRCHLGPDHPQLEVYKESKHGVLFDAHVAEMNLDRPKWVVGVDYSAAPTCATCHMSATTKQATTHDVGQRLSWTLRPVISIKQQDWQRKRVNMREVCIHCHSGDNVEKFFKQFDAAVRLYNTKFAKPAKTIMDQLYKEKLLTRTPFDERIEWDYYLLWHNQGRRARHGAAMMGADYVHWHGFFDVAETFYTAFLPAAEKLKKGITQKALEKDDHAWLKGMTKEQLDLIDKFYKDRYEE